MAVIRCPNCGKPNPDFIEVCQYCDAKLRTADGTPIVSQPPASADDTLVRSGPAAPPAPAAEPEPDDTPLDWMTRLRQKREAPAAEPDWMWTGSLGDKSTTESDAPTAPPAGDDSAVELPEWLRDLDEPINPPPRSPSPSTPLTPAASFQSSPTPAPQAQPTPPEPTPPEPTPPEPTPAAPAPPEPSPFEPAAGDVTIPPRSRRKMTDWLDRLHELPPPSASAEPDAPVIPNTDADLPDWLKAIAAEAETPGSARPAIDAATQHLGPTSAAPTPEEDLPDWLRALRAKTDQPNPAPGTAALQSSPAPVRRNQDLPPNLRVPAADESPSARSATQPLPPDPDDMPDWLQSILAHEATAPPPAPTADKPIATEHPAALTGPAADAARKPGGSRPITGSLIPRGTPAARAIPPAAQPPAAPTATPVPLAAAFTAQPPEEMPPAAPPAASDETLLPPSRPAKRLADWLGKAPTPAETAAPIEEVPEWLKSLSAASAASAAAAEQAAPAAPAGPAAPAATSRTQPPAAPTAASPEPPAAVPADEMPDWLKAMAPPAGPSAVSAATPPASPMPEPAPAASAPTASGAAPADELPDWLKAMAPPTAPSATSAATPPSQAAATPPDELPDWMKDMAAETPAATPAEPPAFETPMPAATVAANEPPAEPPAAEAAPADELPDWLKVITEGKAPDSALPEAATPAPARAAPTPSATDDDLPDWLKTITRAQAGQPPAAPTSRAPEPGATAPMADNNADLPDWLKAITQASDAAAAEATGAGAPAPAAAEATPVGAADAAPAAFDAETTLVSGPALPTAAEPLEPNEPARPVATPADQPASADATLPPWLIGVGTTPLPDVQELPDLDEETLAWLSESKKAETTPEPAGLDLTDTKLPAEKPEWLDELAAATPASAPAATPEIAPTPAEEMPNWLRTMRSAAAEETPAAGDTPDWLRALRSQAPSTPGATAPSDAEAEARITAITQPPVTTPPAATTTTPAAAPEAAGLARAALPAWLAAMRPVDIETPVAGEADSYEETLGVLAGMRGVLRAEPVVAQPHKAAATLQNLVVSDANTAQVKMLTELLRTETAVLPIRHRRVGLRTLAERWVIFALLLLALVLAQFQPQLGLPALFAAPAATLPPESAAVFSLIESLPNNKPALVAFDYDASQSGELDPGAAAVIGHLAHRGLPVVAVSLRLTGPAAAEQVLTQAAASGYVNLGYIAGGPVGLLQFAADPSTSFLTDFSGNTEVWRSAILTNIHSLADFGLIVLVSGTPESTRAWIEQAQAFAVSVPTVAVISAGAEPMVRPYYDDPNTGSAVMGQLPLKGLIVGLTGAAAYEQATAAPGAASALWPAMGGGLLAAALIILLGNLFFGVFGALRRRRA